MKYTEGYFRKQTRGDSKPLSLKRNLSFRGEISPWTLTEFGKTETHQKKTETPQNRKKPPVKPKQDNQQNLKSLDSLKTEVYESNLRLTVLRQFRKYLLAQNTLPSQASSRLQPIGSDLKIQQCQRVFHPSLFQTKTHRPKKGLRILTNRHLNEALSYNEDYCESFRSAQKIRNSAIPYT